MSRFGVGAALTNLLYRGVNPDLHTLHDGKMKPKDRLPFARPPEWGRAAWGKAYRGMTDFNAVIEHQLDQAGYPTSGISTTPHLDRAIWYATHNGNYPEGYVYVIDRSACRHHGVAEYIVNEIVPYPSVPGDEEVILVSPDYGTLPPEILVEIRKVRALQPTGR